MAADKTLGKSLRRHGVSRRGFLKYCSAVASMMKSRRSSALKSVFCLRNGLLTTPTTTRSKTSEDLVMMSMWPLVTGS